MMAFWRLLVLKMVGMDWFRLLLMYMGRVLHIHIEYVEFHKGAADHTFMRIDGEPWKQPLLVDDDTVVVEISHLGQVKMLATYDCRSKSVHNPSSHNIQDAD